jgi:hypothetical protein
LKSLPENLNSPFGKEGTVELFFDKGEPFMHKIDKIWRTKSENKPQVLQLVSSIEQSDTKTSIGLQAADFLAWSVNRYHTYGLNDKYSNFGGGFIGVSRCLATPLWGMCFDFKELKELSEYYQHG